MGAEIGQFTVPKSGQNQGGPEFPLQLLPCADFLISGEKALRHKLLQHLHGRDKGEVTAGLSTAYLDDSLEVRSATVGHFMDHVEGKIVHIDTGEKLPAGETGEICVRGYLVMAGYFGQPEETAKAIDADGWLHTGDLGWLDADGNIHLTERLKELIIRGGENISPAEIETALGSCPEIAECKAVGVPDRHYGEEVCLCVVLQKDATLNELEIRAILSRELAMFKVPKYILFLDELPKSANRKIQTGKLTELICKTLGLGV